MMLQTQETNPFLDGFEEARRQGAMTIPPPRDISKMYLSLPPRSVATFLEGWKDFVQGDFYRYERLSDGRLQTACPATPSVTPQVREAFLESRRTSPLKEDADALLSFLLTNELRASKLSATEIRVEAMHPLDQQAIDIRLALDGMSVESVHSKQGPDGSTIFVLGPSMVPDMEPEFGGMTPAMAFEGKRRLAESVSLEDDGVWAASVAARAAQKQGLPAGNMWEPNIVKSLLQDLEQGSSRENAEGNLWMGLFGEAPDGLTVEGRLREDFGVTYFNSYAEAVEVRDGLLPEWREARIVEYERGHAVQYYKSGPYYPADPEAGSQFNPANWQAHESKLREGYDLRVRFASTPDSETLDSVMSIMNMGDADPSWEDLMTSVVGYYETEAEALDAKEVLFAVVGAEAEVTVVPLGESKLREDHSLSLDAIAKRMKQMDLGYFEEEEDHCDCDGSGHVSGIPDDIPCPYHASKTKFKRWWAEVQADNGEQDLEEGVQRITQIDLSLAEGPNDLVGGPMGKASVGSFPEANAILSGWQAAMKQSLSSRNQEWLGYYKTDVVITFADGHRHSFRYDIENPDKYGSPDLYPMAKSITAGSPPDYQVESKLQEETEWRTHNSLSRWDGNLDGLSWGMNNELVLYPIPNSSGPIKGLVHYHGGSYTAYARSASGESKSGPMFASAAEAIAWVEANAIGVDGPPLRRSESKELLREDYRASVQIMADDFNGVISVPDEGWNEMVIVFQTMDDLEGFRRNFGMEYPALTPHFLWDELTAKVPLDRPGAHTESKKVQEVVTEPDEEYYESKSKLREGMQVVWLSVNQAYAIFLGEDLSTASQVDLDGQYFWDDLETLRTDLRYKGLALADDDTTISPVAA